MANGIRDLPISANRLDARAQPVLPTTRQPQGQLRLVGTLPSQATGANGRLPASAQPVLPRQATPRLGGLPGYLLAGNQMPFIPQGLWNNPFLAALLAGMNYTAPTQPGFRGRPPFSGYMR